MKKLFFPVLAVLAITMVGCGGMPNMPAEVEERSIPGLSGSAAFYVHGTDKPPLIQDMMHYEEAFMHAYKLRVPFSWIPWTEYKSPAQFKKRTPIDPVNMVSSKGKPTRTLLDPTPRAWRSVPHRRSDRER